MKWKIPLSPRNLRGYFYGVPVVTFRVRTRYGTWSPVRFVVDTGADISGMPISLARAEAIAFPETEEHRGQAIGLAGAIDQFAGSIHVRIGKEDFDWPCNFLSSTAGTAHRRYGVLGRAAFLSAFTICIDEPFLFLQRRLTDRRWWYRFGVALMPWRARFHSFDVPL
jgi:hypothetical protein